MKKIDKKEASRLFVELSHNEVQSDYNKFLSDMTESYGNDFKLIKNNNPNHRDPTGLMSFFMARVSIQCYPLGSIFSETKSSLILVTVMHTIAEMFNLPVDWTRNELFTNLKLIDENDHYFESADPLLKLRPIEIIMERFLTNHLGANIEKFYLKKGKTKISEILHRPNVISPMFTVKCTHHLISFKTTWLDLVERYEIS